MKTCIFSRSRKEVDQKKRRIYTTNQHFFSLELIGSANSDFFFLVQEKNLSL